MNARPPVHSLYWGNVNAGLRAAQQAVFDHLGIPLRQELRDGVQHGDWMDEVLSRGEGDVAVFCDIDAVPLRADAFDALVAAARAGAVAGMAQSSNHLSNPGQVYAGPMFLAVRRALWQELGRPSMAPDEDHDAGQRLSVAAAAAGVPLELRLPNACLKPMWNLAGRRVFGIGTFYGEMEFFHLFQSRKTRNIRLFHAVCEDVTAGRAPDFGRYLVTLNGKRRMPKPLRRFFD
jgi:hypothetical protein